ncbi:MAG: FAD:protein FMN transferase [Clostridia bacterium]
MNKLLSIIFIVFICSGCAEINPTTRTELIFDTPVTISIYDDVEDQVLTDAFSLCRNFEQRFSKTVESSEVSKLNNADGETIQASDELVMLLKTALDFTKTTSGLFDVTTYTLSEVWDFKNPDPQVPSQDEIDYALSTIGYYNIVIEGNSVRLLNNAKIDLGGIVKGYAADEIKNFLIEQGVNHATINIGGNVLTIGKKNNTDLWAVGIREPFEDENTVLMSVEVDGLSVVTSGPYERNFTIDGVLYHHILNPKTGYPADSDLSSVTIITEKSIIADTLSTSCYLMGLDKAIELIESTADTEAVFIDNNGEIIVSSGIGETITVNYFD